MPDFVERIRLYHQCRSFLFAWLLPMRLGFEVGGPDLTPQNFVHSRPSEVLPSMDCAALVL